jgi:hypothetical protein
MQLGKVFLALLVTGCSSYSPPESFESKMSYFQANSASKNSVPDFRALPVMPNRSPASSLEVSRETANLSTKRLYFMTLHDQYEEFKQISEINSPTIQRCPNFHSGLVDNRVRVSKENQMNQLINWMDLEQKLSKHDELKSNPELQLPMSEHEIYPNVSDVYLKDKTNKNLSELVREGMRVHLKKLQAELEELCEHGNSDNYYAFENLITSVSNKGLEPAADGAKILLKTTLVSNMVLLNSLQRWIPSTGRSPASVTVNNNNMSSENSKQNEIFRRLKTPWAKNYLSQYRQR